MRKIFTSLASLAFVAAAWTTAGAESPVTADPKDGSQLTELTRVVIESSSNDPLWYSPGASEIAVYKDDVYYGGVNVHDNDDGTYVLNMEKDGFAPGKYKIDVPQAAFLYLNTTPVPAFELNYTVLESEGDDPSQYPVNIFPESGSTFDEPLKNFTIKTAVSGFNYLDVYDPDQVKVYYEGEYYCGVSREGLSAATRLHFNKPLSESGQYRIFVPKDCWSMYETADSWDEYSYDINVFYTIELPGVKYNISIDAASLTPAGTKLAPTDLAGGSCSRITFTASGELCVVPGAKARVICSRNDYDEEAPLTSQADEDGVTTFYIDLLQAIDQDGEYVLSIPRGSFGDDEFITDPTQGRANRAFTREIVFTGGKAAGATDTLYDLEVNATKPAQGIVDLKTTTWTATQVMVDADLDVRPGSQVSLTGVGNDYSAVGELTSGVVLKNTRTMVFANGRAPEHDGTYVLTIPQGTFGDQEWLADPEKGHSNPELKLYFIVTGGVAPAGTFDIEVSEIAPASESTIDLAEAPLAITFKTPGTLDFKTGILMPMVCTSSEGITYASITGATTEGGVTTFTTEMMAPVVYNGSYTFTIPAGAFGDEAFIKGQATGHANKEFTARYTVTGGQQPPVSYDLIPEVDPIPETPLMFAELDNIVLTFPQGTVMTTTSAKGVCTNDEKGSTLVSDYAPTDVSGQYELDFSQQEKKEGVYVYTLEQGIFSDRMGAHRNPEITYSWTYIVLGVDSVEADGTQVLGIYDMNGVYVGTDLKALPAGCYVVKGRKIRISK